MNLLFRDALVDRVSVFKVVCLGHFESLVAMRECLPDCRRVSDQLPEIVDHLLSGRRLAILVVVPLYNERTSQMLILNVDSIGERSNLYGIHSLKCKQSKECYTACNNFHGKHYFKKDVM